jgi:hypothetical protein
MNHYYEEEEEEEEEDLAVWMVNVLQEVEVVLVVCYFCW